MGNQLFDQLRQAGFSEQEILAEAGFSPEEMVGKPPERTTGQRIYDLAGSALQGLTFGFGDELTAGVGALTGRGYKNELTRQRSDLNAYEQAHPYESATAEVGGSIASALATGGAGAAKTAVRSPSFIARALRAGKLGAGYGATYGAGKGEGLVGTAEGAAQGGITGALLGPATELGMTAVGKALKPARQGAGKISDALLKYGLGARGSDTQKGVNRGVEFLNATGDVTKDISQAVTRRGKFDKAIEIVKGDGLLDALNTSNRDKIATKVEQRVATLAKEIDPLVVDADAALKSAQVGTNATVKLKPDFRPVRDWIKNNVPADKESSLLRLVDAEEQSFAGRAGTVREIMNAKQKLNVGRFFSGTQSMEDSTQAEVYRLMYGAYKQAAENAVDIGLARTAPELAGRFKALNTKIWAYKMLDEPLSRPQSYLGGMSGAVKQGVLGAVLGMGTGSPGAALAPLAVGGATSAFPIQTSKLASVLASAPTTERVMGRVTPIIAAEMGAAKLKRNDESLIPLGGVMENLKPLLNAMKGTERSGSKAVSPKGAKGIAQLMDATGREYHRRLKIAKPYDPTDDNQAEQIALAFLGDLARKYNNDPALIAAGYNMGEKNLNKFIRKYGASWDAISPHLQGDFLETKRYVPTFLANLRDSQADATARSALT